MIRSLFPLLVFSLVLLSCSSAPRDLIDEEMYIKMLAEFEVVRSDLESSQDPHRISIADRMNMVFESYGVSRERFERSHEWYSKDNEAQTVRHRRALDLINELIGKLSPDEPAKSDSVKAVPDKIQPEDLSPR